MKRLTLITATLALVAGTAHAEQLCSPREDIATLKPGQTITLDCEQDGQVIAYPTWHAGNPPFVVGWETTPEAAAREGEPSGFTGH